MSNDPFRDFCYSQDLHLLSKDKLKDRFISSESFWEDVDWFLPKALAGGPIGFFSWDISGPGGASLMDPEWSSLLDMGRRFIWAMVRKSVTQGRLPDLNVFRVRFTPLLSWMMATQTRSFSEITPATAMKYAHAFASAKWSDQPDDSQVVVKTVAGYFAMLLSVYELGPALSKTPGAVIAAHPFGGQTALSIAKRLEPQYRRPLPHGDGFIPPVPDEILSPAMEEAILWINDYAPDIIGALEMYGSSCLSIEDDYTISVSDRRRIDGKLKNYVFNGGGVRSKPWRPRLGARWRLDPTRRGVSPRGDLRRLIQDLIGACTIIVQGLLGMRIGEVLGLVAQRSTKLNGVLPDCVSIEMSLSGLEEHFIVRGPVSKPVTSGDDDGEWLAGSRPVGSDYLPLPVVALQRLFELSKVWADGPTSELIRMPRFSGRGGRLEPEDPMSYEFGDLQTKFLQRHVSLPDGVQNWRLSTHQWRKSFGQYMVRTDERLLPAVAEHMQHVGVATAERNYIGRSAVQLGLHRDASLQMSVSVLSDMIYGDGSYAGKFAEMVRSRKSAIRRRLETDTNNADPLSVLTEYMKDEDFLVWSSGWGSCVFRAETSLCHYESKGEFDLSAISPDVASRRAEICQRCSNLVVSPNNMDFWQGRYKENIYIYRRNMEIGERRLAAAALKKVRTARDVLRQLGVACGEDDFSGAF